MTAPVLVPVGVTSSVRAAAGSIFSVSESNSRGSVWLVIVGGEWVGLGRVEVPKVGEVWCRAREFIGASRAVKACL